MIKKSWIHLAFLIWDLDHCY